MSDPRPAASAPGRPQPGQSHRMRRVVLVSVLVLAGIIALLTVASAVWTDVLWYRQVGFLSVLTKQWVLGGGMALAGFLALAAPVWASLWFAFRSRPTYVRVNATLDQYQQALEPLRGGITGGLPVLFGVFGAVVSASHWSDAALWANGESTGTTDPQFGIDLSFYLFQLPFYRKVVSYLLFVAVLCAILTIVVSYLYGSIRFEQRRLRIAKSTRIQLGVVVAVYVALQAASLWLQRYETLTDSSGLYTGGTYTGVNAVIPGRAILAAVAVLVAIGFVVAAATGRWRVPLVGAVVLVVASIVVGVVVPWGMQTFVVQPSERELEGEYLQRNIDATRTAYGVDDVDVEQYDAVTDAQAGALRSDVETTASIRLLDPDLVSDTFRQLQQYKQYYQFGSQLDVDRYEIDGETTDTVLAVRELSQQQNDSWYNNAIVYTHGYGVVAAYGNRTTSDGKPVFYESGIPTSGDLGDFEPRIYFGEKSPRYSIVGGGDDRELDYPSGATSTESGGDQSDSDQEQTYTTFQGDGGPRLGDGLTRLLYALKFGSIEILTSNAVSDESQILYERDPVERVKKVAPYLTLDQDVYPAIVDGRVKWIVDGYTTSDQYPYSQQQSYRQAINDGGSSTTGTPATDTINYMRNSVKATVDAYDGSVTLYAWDTDDPVLSAWQRVFPNTVQPISEMSAQLLSHVRYPTDLFKAQRNVLGTYHVTDAGSFYSKQDAWQVPADPQASTDTSAKQPPYYLSMRLPGQDETAFTLYSTFIPIQQSSGGSRNVLRGYLAADGDAGSTTGEVSDDYGRLTLLRLPSETNVPGPGQVQNMFDSDNTVSTQLNLLRQGQTTVTSGNLLTLPVGGGLLYVQPVYVRSTGETSYPLLRKILVAFGDKVAFEDTLDQALDDIFGGDSGAAIDQSGGTTSASSGGTGGQTDQSGAQGGASSDGAAANPTVAQALQDAKAALDEREKARVSGDWAAYGTADQKLQDALQRAINAEG